MTKVQSIQECSTEDAVKILQDAVRAIQCFSGGGRYEYLYLGYQDENKIKNQLGQFVPFNFQTNTRKTGR